MKKAIHTRLRYSPQCSVRMALISGIMKRGVGGFFMLTPEA